MNNQEPNNPSTSLHKRSWVYQYLRDIVKDAVDERIQATEQWLTNGIRKQREETINNLTDVVLRQRETVLDKITGEVQKQQEEAAHKLTGEVWKQQKETVEKLTREIWRQEEAIDKLADEIWKQQSGTVDKLIGEIWKQQADTADKLTGEVHEQQKGAVDKLTGEIWKQQGEAVDKLIGEVWKQQREAVDRLISEIWKQQKEAVDKLIEEIWKQQRESLQQIEEQKQSDRNRLVKLMPRNICRFQTHIVEHCNLNCASCAHYSPLHDEEYLSVEEYKKDYQRLSTLFSGEAELIEILGGEPLLHPEITEFMAISRDCFPYAPIHILTNGLLLPKMPEEFWQAMKTYAITLRMTRYPIKFDYDGWARKVKAMGIQVWLADEEVTWVTHKLDLSGGIPNEEAAERNLENYLNCYESNFCVALEHGRLYTCPQVAYAKTFVDYFNAPIDITDRDSIDIHKAQSAEEITAFLSRPIPFCRYCRVKERHVIPWGRSRKVIEEWS